MFVQEVIAMFIASGAVAHVVRYAVDLDRQIGARAEEIEDVWTSGMLFAEFEAAW